MGGFFGTISSQSCVNDLFYGIDYNSHLGTRRAGMATLNKETGRIKRDIHSIENSYFRTKFEADLKDFSGNSGIGVISDNDAQPIILNSHLGKFAIVTVACVNNIAELEKEMLDKGLHFAELSSGQTNPTELIALLITQGKDFVEGIENVYRKVKGSCSMLLLTEDGLIAARDKFGRTPIVLGKKEGAMAVSSEPCSFPNLDFSIEHYVDAGEICLLTESGYTVLRKPEKRRQFCAFMWVYFGYPVSDYDGINVDNARYRCGIGMAKDDKTEADMVSGIPDSGIGVGLGYAETRELPYRRSIIKYTPTWPRSFTPSDQTRRSLVAKMKLMPNQALLRDKRVIFCDDSIVRGTQLKDNVSTLFQCGAKEVHMRIGCPPILYSCPFLKFTASKSDMELIARRKIVELEGVDNEHISEECLREYADCHSERYRNLVEAIRKQFDITSLKFSTLENLVEAIGLPKDQLCTHCYDGSSYFE